VDFLLRNLKGIISKHPAGSEAAVNGIPDEKWGERPLVLVVVKEGFQWKISEEELLGFFSQK
jgi:fatty-acyl-CoA synthase